MLAMSNLERTLQLHGEKLNQLHQSVSEVSEKVAAAGRNRQNYLAVNLDTIIMVFAVAVVQSLLYVFLNRFHI